MAVFNIVIRNGWVADGTGNPAFPADVAVQGDRIAAVGRLPQSVESGRTIDATGMIVFPGGVDIHTHVAGAALNFARAMTPENA